MRESAIFIRNAANETAQIMPWPIYLADLQSSSRILPISALTHPHSHLYLIMPQQTPPTPPPPTPLRYIPKKPLPPFVNRWLVPALAIFIVQLHHHKFAKAAGNLPLGFDNRCQLTRTTRRRNAIHSPYRREVRLAKRRSL
jgi:hypothetical protein